MRKLLGLMPAFGQPCISPFVSKAAYFLTMSGLEYQFECLDPGRVQAETPLGKVPVLVEDDGQRIHDSTFIIDHVRNTYGDALDAGLTPEEQAVALAFDRLLGEHVYWSGAIEPRWRDDHGFDRYVHDICGGMPEIPPPVRAFLDQARVGILAQQRGHGMGRRPSAEVLEVLKVDLDAVSTFLGDKPFFLGEEPRWIDASVYSHIGHVIRVPFDWPGRTYAASKPNLVAYLERMRARFGFPELTGDAGLPLARTAAAPAAAERAVERDAA